MVSSIYSDLTSLMAQRSLNKVNRSIHTASERISSGKRINSAKDDASGLAIAQRLTSMGEGLLAATRNANDAISMVQTAESGMSGVTENLQRIRELSIQAANGTLNDSDRKYIQSEVNALKEEISRVTDTTSFGGKNLLNNDEEMSFQVGAEAGESVSVRIGNLDEQLQAQGVGAIDLTTVDGANAAIGVIDEALEGIATTQAELGAVQNRFESTINNLSSSFISAESARSRIEDADLAKEIANMSRNRIQEQASIAMLGHANQDRGIVMKLLNL